MKPKNNPFLHHPLALAASLLMCATTAHAQTYYFDVNGTTAGSGIVNTGVYDWTGANWADDNTGTATTSTKNWSSGNSVVFASTADVGANSYTVTLPGGYTQTWVKDLTVNSGNLSISNGSNANFVLGANSTWTVATGSSLSINSSGNSGWRAVNMNGSSLVLDTQGTATATIAGLNNTSGSVTKNGTGTLTLTDEGNYSGGTTINAGTLTATRGSIGSGAVVINNNATLNVADQWVFSGSNPYGVSYPNPASLTINAGGTLQLDATNGFANGATNLYLNGGLVTGGPNDFRGDLYLYNGNEQITAGGATTSTIASVIGVTGNNNTITVDSGSTLNITGVVKNSDWFNNGSTPGGLIKAGAGTLTLSGANSYTGSTAINDGTLKLQGAAFSTTARAYTIATGAVLNLDGGTGVASGTTTIGGTGTLRISGAGLSNGVGGGRNINMELTGAAALIDIQSGSSIYNGGWQSMIWTSNSAGMRVDGDFNLADGNNVFVDELTGAGTVGGSNARTLTVGVNNGSGTFSGAIGGSISFTKNGTGTQTLSGTNTYTGATTVNDGKLVINGSISTSSLTTVKSGATLGGSGTVGALTIESGGFFSPGNSPGIITVNGNYSQSGSLIAEAIGLTPGSGHDQVIVNGSVTLNGLLSLTMSTFTPVAGDKIFLILNDGEDAVSGTFTDLAQNAVWGNYGGFDWIISYTANGDSLGSPSFTGGNDIALMAVPEPHAALLGGLGMLCLLRRRRA